MIKTSDLKRALVLESYRQGARTIKKIHDETHVGYQTIRRILREEHLAYDNKTKEVGFILEHTQVSEISGTNNITVVKCYSLSQGARYLEASFGLNRSTAKYRIKKALDKLPVSITVFSDENGNKVSMVSRMKDKELHRYWKEKRSKKV